jgi:hypothetical protein
MRAAAVLWCAIMVDAQTEIATPGLGMHESVYKNTKDGTRFPNKTRPIPQTPAHSQLPDTHTHLAGCNVNAENCKTEMPRCPGKNELVKESRQWQLCCFDPKKDCLPDTAQARAHGWFPAMQSIGGRFQLGSPPFLAVPLSASIGNVQDCEKECLDKKDCMYGTYITSGARAGECWISAETSSQLSHCPGPCQSFHKITASRSGLDNKHILVAGRPTPAPVNATDLPDDGQAAPTNTQPGNSTYGRGKSVVCGAVTPPLTGWRVIGSHGAVYVDVDSSRCQFGATPQYSLSIVAKVKHWQASGSHVIVNSTASSFRVLVYHPLLSGAYLKQAVYNDQWQVSWIGDSGANTGRTMPGNTGWRRGGAADGHGLYVDVDAAGCNFKTTPRFFPALVGGDAVLTRFMKYVNGQHIVYYPNFAGFRVYVNVDECIGSKCHTRGRRTVSPQEAELYGWTISWIGFDSDCKGVENCADTYQVLDKRHRTSSGTSDASWAAVDKVHDGTFLDVDTSASEFDESPAYVSAVVSHHMQWVVTGGGTIYNPFPNGFRVYLWAHGKHSIHASFARLYKWKVNYFGFDGKWQQDCVVDVWGQWGECSSSCGGGERAQKRQVLANATHGGKACPVRIHRKSCGHHQCPVDCLITDWGAWVPKCDVVWNRTTGGCSAAGMGTQLRARLVMHEASLGGKACPIHVQAAVDKARDKRSASRDYGGLKSDPLAPVPLTQNRQCSSSAVMTQRACAGPPTWMPAFGEIPADQRSYYNKAGKQEVYTDVAVDSRNQTRICGDTTAPGSGWKRYGKNGAFLRVNASGCQFGGAAQVVFSMRGLQKYTEFGALAGTSSVSKTHWSTPESRLADPGDYDWFEVVLWFPAFKGEDWFGIAESEGWHLSWLGAVGPMTGSTLGGKTGWKLVDSKGAEAAATFPTQGLPPGWGERAVYVDVDTSLSVGGGDEDGPTPTYLSSLHGLSKHWRTSGAGTIYMPTRSGFRCYVFLQGDAPSSMPLDKLAEMFQWRVVWIAAEKHRCHSGLSAPAPAPGSKSAAPKDTVRWHNRLLKHSAGMGKSGDDMMASASHVMALADVRTFPEASVTEGETAAGGLLGTTGVVHKWDGAARTIQCPRFGKEPSYVATLVVDSLWGYPLGAVSLSESQRLPIWQGFSVSQYATFQPDLANWRVSYIGYEDVDCTYSDWHPWSACTRTCGGGMRARRRTVLLEGQGRGRHCPRGRERQKQLEHVNECGFASCIGSGPSVICGGTSGRQSKQVLAAVGDAAAEAEAKKELDAEAHPPVVWRRYGTNGLYADIVTTTCGYHGTNFSNLRCTFRPLFCSLLLSPTLHSLSTHLAGLLRLPFTLIRPLLRPQPRGLRGRQAGHEAGRQGRRGGRGARARRHQPAREGHLRPRCGAHSGVRGPLCCSLSFLTHTHPPSPPFLSLSLSFSR